MPTTTTRLPALFAALGPRSPLVFTPHYHGRSDSRFRNALHRPYRLLGSRIMERSARVIAVAPAEAVAARRALPRAAAKIVVVPNGVDAERLSAAAPFEYAGSRVVLCAGRIDSYKRLDQTIRALAHLDQRFVLRITGEGPMRPELEGLIRELGLDGAGRVPRPGGGRRALPMVPYRRRLRDDVRDRGDAGHPAGGAIRGRPSRGQRHPRPPRHGAFRRRAPQPGAAVGSPPQSWRRRSMPPPRAIPREARSRPGTACSKRPWRSTARPSPQPGKDANPPSLRSLSPGHRRPRHSRQAPCPPPRVARPSGRGRRGRRRRCPNRRGGLRGEARPLLVLPPARGL